jgi:hypothetical protein
MTTTPNQLGNGQAERPVSNTFGVLTRLMPRVKIAAASVGNSPAKTAMTATVGTGGSHGRNDHRPMSRHAVSPVIAAASMTRFRSEGLVTSLLSARPA